MPTFLPRLSLLLLASALEAATPPALTVEPSTLTLKPGETGKLAAAVTGSTSDVHWASSNPGFAAVAPDGLVTAVHPGSLTISAMLADNAAFASCRVTVLDPAAEAAPAGPRGEITGIVIANNIGTMTVGDDLGIVACCLPYKVFEANPFTLESSDTTILTVSPARIVTAVATGTVTLTARTPNGKTDRVTVEVKPPVDATPRPAEIYTLEPARFGIVPGEVDAAQAKRNSAGINHALLYARRWGYRGVVFPKGLYQLDPADSISMRSDLRVDLNGSTWQVMPNPYPRYSLIRFKELNGPNLSTGYEVATEPATNHTLSPRPLGRFTVHEGTATILSRPIPVGPLPGRDAPDQVVRCLETGSVAFLSSPIGVVKTILDPELRHSIEVRLKVHYTSNGADVAVKDLGPVWLRETTGKLWCDLPATLALRPQADHDAIRLELAFALRNCKADIFPGQAVVCRKIEGVLSNARLVNGTILGERDFKEPLYPKWKEDGATEGGVSISFEEGPDNGIENLVVRKSIGFNMGSGMGSRSAGAVGPGPVPLKFQSLEPGGLDDSGQPVAAGGLQRTGTFVDLTPLGETYELGLPLGYMGYNILRARVYDIAFYDRGTNLLELRRGRLAYRQYAKPAGAVRAKIAFHWDTPITAGHPDFNGAFGFLTTFQPPVRNFIRNCVIEDNYSCGFAACGGINWRIEGNTFRRNGGRMPGCDIDWEDGWEYAQDDVVRNNVFESPNGVIVCAGVNHVFRNNVHRGSLTVYGRSQHLKFEGNTFGGEGRPASATFGTQTDMHIVGNRFLGGSVRFEREHKDKAGYQPVWQGNILTGTKVRLPGE